MNDADKLFRKIRSLSFKIAHLSAIKDSPREWWGMDTDIGDLPLDIQKELSKFADWIEKNIGNNGD